MFSAVNITYITHNKNIVRNDIAFIIKGESPSKFTHGAQGQIICDSLLVERHYSHMVVVFKISKAQITRVRFCSSQKSPASACRWHL
jgi:hypothetical protein